MTARRSRLRGAAALRRLMRRMPHAVQAEIVGTLEDGGGEMAGAMRARTPFKTGDLREGISHKVFARTMKLEVGLIGTKAGRSKLFYGRILDLGRKAQTVTVRRGVQPNRPRPSWLGGPRRKMSPPARIVTYRLRVKPIAPMRFVTGSYRDLRMMLSRSLKSIWNRAVGKAAGGGE